MIAKSQGYSDQMARRIRCLKIGSFDCLVRGGVFTEVEARAVVQYLEIRYSAEGFCIACARAQHENATVGWLHDDDLSPTESAARVLRVRTGNRGFVYHRHDEDDIVLLWTSKREGGHEEVRRMFAAASQELASRHGIVLAYTVGGWRTELVAAHESLAEARTLFARGGGATGISGGEMLSVWTDELSAFRAERAGLCANEPVRSIQEFILEHYHDHNLTLKTVASRFRLTETYLSQLFKEQTGTNYSVFLEQNRVEEARWMLEQSELGISEVASRVGYEINSTFYRAFHRIYGMSPTTFRKMARGRAHSGPGPSGHAVAV